MSEREEIQLRGLRSIWQSRQDVAGVMTLFLGLLTLGVFLFFLSAPDKQLAGVLVCFMGLLVICCWRLISSAARVAEIAHLLNPTQSSRRFKPEIIEAEVVDPCERRVLSM